MSSCLRRSVLASRPPVPAERRSIHHPQPAGHDRSSLTRRSEGLAFVFGLLLQYTAFHRLILSAFDNQLVGVGKIRNLASTCRPFDGVHQLRLPTLQEDLGL